MQESRTSAPVTTRTGDDGYTGLLGPERVPKYDQRVEACGEVDEATSALGLARATIATTVVDAEPALEQTLLSLQRDLYTLMAELAASPAVAARLPRRLGAADVLRLETLAAELLGRAAVGREFVLPGNSPAGATLDLARAVVRRAERRIARLAHEGWLANPDALRYVNRLSDLLFVMARAVERDAGRASEPADETRHR